MKFKPLVLAAAAASLFSTAHAADGAPEIKVSGFGTIGAAVSDDGDVQFRKTFTNGTGVDDKIDLGSESRLGLQGDVRFGHGLSVTAQVVAMRRLDGGTAAAPVDKDLDPGVEWLYAQYQINDAFNVRLGRMQLPAFLLSDSLNVGYATPWMRAPAHIYASQPFSRLDGVQGNWRQSFGGFNLGAQLSYGRTAAMLLLLNSVGERKADYVAGLNFTVESGNWLGRAGVVEMKLPPPSGVFVPIKDQYLGLGLQYDDGQLLVMSEWAKRSENDQRALGNRPFMEGDYAYVSAGWRFGKLLPMVTWGHGDNTSFSGTFVTDKASSIGASVRYDIAPNFALKAQVDRFEANDGSVFVTRAADDHAVHVFTAGVDFVF